MLTLDSRTIIVIYLLVNYICTLSLVLIWIKNRQVFRGLSLIVADFLFQSIGMTLASLYGSISPYLSIVAANILMISGAAFFLFGIGDFLNQKVKRHFYIGYILLFTILYTYFGIFNPVVPVRIIIFNGMIIPIFIHILKIVFVDFYSRKSKTALYVGFTSILFTLVFALRAYYGITSDGVTDYFASIKVDDLLVVLSLLCTILLTLSVNMMVNNELLQHLEKLATTDPLTKISNRRATENIMFEETKKKRNKTEFCVLLIDIDDFKKLNDTYGHDVGDKALIHVTRLLSKNIRKKDSFGRWGGEEFLIVLPDTNIDIASSLADRLVNAINKNAFTSCGTSISMSISIGVSQYKEGSTIESVIKNADNALYEAKRNGKNRYECSS